MKLLLNAVLAATVATITAKLVSDHVERATRAAREEAKHALEKKEDDFEREKQALIACIEEHKAEHAAARIRERSAAKELDALQGDVQQLLLASTRLKFMAQHSLRTKQRRRKAGGGRSGELSRRKECAVGSATVKGGTQTRPRFGARKQSDDKRREPEKLNGNQGLALVNCVRQLFGLDERHGQRRRNEAPTLRLETTTPRRANPNKATP
ncbi:hypothetical protein BWQ96_01886 [Gracilariopsis chorda]|uniref:Uncharacterized protein n=1 Tax=Gracilariopsis chorda TaxID=448386 RepID=A0A2V3J1W7_9FLOR|nr:hypothetical protein BWQ96_01886 [Gracilariopsis chorda]|eukprot:PXF48426.1 hypothetical protein BWQ96_01886 [Gracilariopsis chorda]